MSRKTFSTLFVLVFVALVAMMPQNASAMNAQPPMTVEIQLQDGGDPMDECLAKATWQEGLKCLFRLLLSDDKNPKGGTVPTNVEPAPGNEKNPNVTGTNCSEAEKLVTGKGTETDPLIYPNTYFHDSCFGWVNGGTGTKFVQVPGPTAAQMGEASGPHRMVFIPKGTTYRGWLQAFWRYVSDDALLIQWKIEDLSVGRYGLICGYERNTKMKAPAFKWDGSKEIRASDLDCPLTLQQLLGSSAAPNPLAPNALTSGSTMDFQTYPSIFKFEWQGKFYCGAKTADSQFPTGYRHIEVHNKGAGDGNYLHDGSTYGMSKTAFCSGQPVDVNGNPVSQKEWITVLLTGNGNLQEVAFPLK